ncbi:hypothetical protein N7508_006662 [Penicillium antarcticum]|uniref:uncharacterized protein n=1 Tax=Penicillium antarcticum TaxID=416450 RepID=UPI00239E5684|nr:uncharacterized protein N7508_006662 [Penicillium antarcticum]KAJ5301799.1 hypothetical protein N7508_006662 [Penicillium antarcticum]
MSDKKEVLHSEAILEKYGKALEGKTSIMKLIHHKPTYLTSIDSILVLITGVTPYSIAGYLDNMKLAKTDDLVCMAGVMNPPYGKTKDGIEQQLAVNYLANFLLIGLLWPKVVAAGDNSSIVVVASSAVRVGKMDWEEYNVRGLSARFQGMGLRIRAFSVDPGAVRAPLLRHSSPEFLLGNKEQRVGTYDTVYLQELSHKRIISLLALHGIDGNPFEVLRWTSTSEGAATIITAPIDPTIAEYSGS